MFHCINRPTLYNSQLGYVLRVTTIIYRFHCINRPTLYNSQLGYVLRVTTICRFHCINRPPLYIITSNWLCPKGWQLLYTASPIVPLYSIIASCIYYTVTFQTVFCINHNILTNLVSLFGVFSLRHSTSIIRNPTWRPRSASLQHTQDKNGVRDAVG